MLNFKKKLTQSWRSSYSRVALITIVASILIFPVYAQTSDVEDAVGDASPASMDIVKTKITQQVGREELLLMMELADLPPPTLPAGMETANYVWSLDTAPGGFPCLVLPGDPFEYRVEVRWTGSSFIAVLVDRTTCTAESPFATTIPLKDELLVSGSTIKAYLNLDLIDNDDVSTINWRSATSYLDLGPPPAVTVLDLAPNLGQPLATLTLKNGE